jgi:hypothetical protein
MYTTSFGPQRWKGGPSPRMRHFASVDALTLRCRAASLVRSLSFVSVIPRSIPQTVFALQEAEVRRTDW